MMMEWSNENSLRFVQEYERQPVLWDIKHPDYYSRNKKNEAWEQIVFEMDMEDLDVAELQKKMRSLMGSFRRERSKIRASLKSDTLYTSKWFAFDALKFLLNRDDVLQDFFADMVATSSEPETPAAIEPSDEPNNTQKKRKLITGSAQDSSACEHRWTRAQPRTNKFSESPTKERHHQDEFDTFGQHVSNQLRSLPLTNAIVCQNYINNYLSEERLKVINAGYQNTRQSKTVDDDQSASNIYLATASNSSIDPMEDYMVDFTSDPNTSDFIKVEDNEIE